MSCACCSLGNATTRKHTMLLALLSEEVERHVAIQELQTPAPPVALPNLMVISSGSVAKSAGIVFAPWKGGQMSASWSEIHRSAFCPVHFRPLHWPSNRRSHVNRPGAC